MAVQKSKKSKSKRNKRRNSNTKFKIPTLSVDKETGECHIRHFITKDGYYKERKIKIKKKIKKIKNNE
jgi:large subunit ribosomal protein L32